MSPACLACVVCLSVTLSPPNLAPSFLLALSIFLLHWVSWPAASARPPCSFSTFISAIVSTSPTDTSHATLTFPSLNPNILPSSLARTHDSLPLRMCLLRGPAGGCPQVGKRALPAGGACSLPRRVPRGASFIDPPPRVCCSARTRPPPRACVHPLPLRGSSWRGRWPRVGVGLGESGEKGGVCVLVF